MIPTIRKPTLWMATSVLLAPLVLSLPAGGAEQDIPITDPALLARLGFEPNAANVYATPQALEEVLTDPAERFAATRTRLEARFAMGAGGPYGTSVGYTPISGKSFLPRFSSTQWAADTVERRECNSGSPFFSASFAALPHGARLSFVGVWYYDASEEDLEVFVFEICRPAFSTDGPQVTLLGSAASAGATGLGYTNFGIAGTVDIDIEDCTYQARVRLDSGIATCSEGTALGLDKVSAASRRQVSPAPATATFNDVPTSHPFFQHIEALVASGITSGCGGDSFCPGAPLTRGQMAVFLATALGLHWGSF